MPDVQSSSAAPHRAVRNSQAAKFHSTLPFLPHLPDSAEEKACRVKKHLLLMVKQEGFRALNGQITFNS